MVAEAVVQRALAYPFDVPEGSYALANGQRYAIAEFSLEPVGDTIVSVAGKAVPLKGLFPDAANLDASHFLPVLASGSNAAVDQLRSKFGSRLNSTIVPVVRARLADLCSVYSAHFASYGSIPATLHWLEGARTELFCLFLPTHLLKRLHASESVGKNYGFYEIDGAGVSVPGCRLATVFSYVSLWGNLKVEAGVVRLPAFPYSGPPVPAMTEPQLFERFVPSLAPEMDTAAFIDRLVRDSAFRARQTEALCHRFSSNNQSTNFHRVA